MSRATAQKVRSAKELEEGKRQTGKVRHGKRVVHVSPTLEQPMRPLQQTTAVNPQQPQFPSRNPASPGNQNASQEGMEGENQMVGTGGSGKRASHIAPTPGQSMPVGLQSIAVTEQSTQSPLQNLRSSEEEEMLSSEEEVRKLGMAIELIGRMHAIVTHPTAPEIV